MARVGGGGASLLLLDYHRIILTCNVTSTAGGAGHVNPSRSPEVTPGLPHIASA